MTGEVAARGPVGSDVERWRTVSTSRLVLAVARTVTSTTRLLEAVELFRDDLRVQVVFTADPGSVFGDGVRALLDSVGAKIIPWDQVTSVAPDLVVTASENADLAAVAAPVVVLPHGVGFHKYVPSPAGGVRLSGLIPDRLTGRDDVVVVVSHPAQIEQLTQASPAAAARAAVIGDPAYDRFLASRRWRSRYRRCLGVGDGRRLVVLSSTWRGQSLWGRWWDLPTQVLASLPVDEYQVAMILHPNVWFGHGPWQVRTWLMRAREAGLAIIPPTAGWQATVLAADVLVGDHGSVTFYAAAIGVPLLVAAFGEEAVPGTAMAELGRLAGRLDPQRPLRRQIEAALTRPEPGQLAVVAQHAFAPVGSAGDALRELLYERMGLPAPAGPVVASAWPTPAPEHTPPASFVVYTHVDAATVVVRRYPAAVDPFPEEETGTVWRHRAVYDDEPDLRAVENASVIVRRDRCAEPTALAWARQELTRNPGARLAAACAGRTCVVALDDARWVVVTSPDADGADGVDPMLSAAAVYTLLRAGLLAQRQAAQRRVAQQRVGIRVGDRDTAVELRVHLS